MAFLSDTATPTTALVAASGTSVAPAVMPGENTHSMMVYNPAGAGDLFFNFAGGAGGALVKDASHVVAAGVSLTFGVGPRSARAGGADIETGLAFDCDAAAAGVTARVTYLNGLEG